MMRLTGFTQPPRVAPAVEARRQACLHDQPPRRTPSTARSLRCSVVEAGNTVLQADAGMQATATDGAFGVRIAHSSLAAGRQSSSRRDSSEPAEGSQRGGLCQASMALAMPLATQPGLGSGTLEGVREGRGTSTPLVTGRACGATAKQLESPPSLAQRVAYQGAPGAYSEDAALKAVPGCRPLPCDRIETVFQAVSHGLADQAVVPIEDSLSGSVHAVYDLLIKHRVNVVGEVSMAVRHCVWAPLGLDAGGLAAGAPDPCACGCGGSDGSHEVVFSAAASHGGRRDWRDLAALASARARAQCSVSCNGHAHGPCSDDDPDHVTRFLVISRASVVRTLADPRPHKTSLAFALPGGPQTLYEALSVFSLRDLDVCKVETRPMHADPLAQATVPGNRHRFRCLFYLDVVGSLADSAMQNALRHLQEVAESLQVLGCYPAEAAPRVLPAVLPNSANDSDSDLAYALASVIPFRKAVAALRTAPPAVAYQGAPGAHSESAALSAVPGCQPLPCPAFETAFEAVAQWLAENAVVPIENSLGGSIHTVYDLLIKHRLHIVGEVTVAVRHCLLAKPGVQASELRRVVGHPHVLSQCASYLRNLPGVALEECNEPGGPARAVADADCGQSAALASARAGELNGLVPLATDVQGGVAGATRYLVLGREPAAPGTEDARPLKTSVVFSLAEGPGSLVRALSVFALRGLPLLKVESQRPRSWPAACGGTDPGCLFHIDFAGDVNDDAAQRALRHLAEIAPFLRVLGCYPCDAEA